MGILRNEDNGKGWWHLGTKKAHWTLRELTLIFLNVILSLSTFYFLQLCIMSLTQSDIVVKIVLVSPAKVILFVECPGGIRAICTDYES